MSTRSLSWAAFAADQSEVIQETLAEDSFDQLAFVGRRALDTNGDRRTVISGDGDNLRAFAPLGQVHNEPPPFFVP